MMVNVIEIFTEYLSVILCVHKIAKKKLIFDRYVVMFFILDLISILVAHKYREEYSWLMIIVYVNFFVYIKMRLSKKWTETIKIFGLMLLIISSLQLIVYYSTKFVFDDIFSKNMYGIVVNSLVCIIIVTWKEKYFYVIANTIKKFSGLVILSLFILFFLYLLYEYKLFEFIYEPAALQTIAGIIVISIISVLWLNTENDKKHRVKELQLYEVYNKTFEEAILAMRARQHEFNNHINAIKCLQLTIDNPIELVKAQNEYCDKILRENSFNKLLKLHTEPVLVGFLYSKFLNAKEQGISIIQEVHSIEIKDKVEVNELVEVIGVLTDNAIEALLEMKDIEKTLIVKILQESNNKILIEVANRSRKYLNSEIEKFCIYGYSTKGDNRGIGLARVKEIAKKYRADFLIENVNYDGENYISFKILL